MKQQTFSDIEYGGRKRITKRDEFLAIMNEIIPWDEWVTLIAPHYPEGKRGRPPIGIDRMLRMFLLQAWYTLSDEGVEDAIYDSYAMRKFMGIDFMKEQVPDATTLLNFRHMMEEHKIGEALFQAIRRVMDQTHHIMHGGTILDATIISAPSSTKNESGERDPEMHQTKKGNMWHFGFKAHTAVDAGTGYVVGLTVTAANVHDITEAHKLIREDDHVVYGDAGYLGIEKRNEIKDNEHLSTIEYRINQRPGTMAKLKGIKAYELNLELEHKKSSVRCKVEHPFLFVKVQCGFKKAVYRGLEKNLNRLYVLFMSSNLWKMARAGRNLVPITG